MDRGVRTAVVTGGTRGIGRALANELLLRGCNVVICGRTDRSVEEAVSNLLMAHGPERVGGWACDVSDPAQVQALWDASVERFGAVDIWINNAGLIHEPRLVGDLPEDAVRAVVGANLIGSLNGSKVAMAGMGARGGAVYNLMGFGSDDSVVPGMSVYGATKAALRYLGDALAKDAEGTDVITGTISPGIVLTELLDTTFNPARAERQRVILNRLTDTAETVAPWIADRVLANTTQGARIVWLTRRRKLWRRLTARLTRRDVFDRHHQLAGRTA